MGNQISKTNIDIGELKRTLLPSASLWQAQLHLARALESCVLAESDQDPTTIDLLLRLYLAQDKGTTGTELCQQLLLSKSHISRRLDRAEKAGLVRSEKDEDDRRARRITLTESGSEVIEAFIPHLVGVLDKTVYEALTAREIETLIGLLRRVTRSTRDLNAD